MTWDSPVVPVGSGHLLRNEQVGRSKVLTGGLQTFHQLQLAVGMGFSVGHHGLGRDETVHIPDSYPGTSLSIWLTSRVAFGVRCFGRCRGLWGNKWDAF